MFKLTTKDTPMHGCRNVINHPEYEPYVGYFKWTKRTWYLGKIPIWSWKIDFKEQSPYELLNFL